MRSAAICAASMLYAPPPTQPPSTQLRLRAHGGIRHRGAAACRICLAVAALECLLGMGLVWGATTGHIQLSYPALLAAGFIFTNSNATIDIVSVSTNLLNWPNDRGAAVGVMKAAVGLSASVYGVLCGALRLDTSALLLLMMLAPALSCLLLMPLVSPVPWIQRSELMPHGLLTTSARFYLAYQVPPPFRWRLHSPFQ